MSGPDARRGAGGGRSVRMPVAARVVLTGIDAVNNELALDHSLRLGLHDRRWHVTRGALAPALTPTSAPPGGPQ